MINYRHIGRSGLEISTISLGGNSFGEPNRTGKEEATYIIHEAIDTGVNFVDTSNVYGGGLSEQYIGNALRGRRDDMLIGTKFGSRREPGPNKFGGSRKFIMNAVDASLERLQTDYIDIYMVHRPDTRMHIEETLRAMDDLVSSGKVRYTGCCNFESWRLVNAVWTAKSIQISQFICTQFAFSLINRKAEQEMIPACRELGVGIMPYLPLAAGLLTGSTSRNDDSHKATRFSLNQDFAARWLTEQNILFVSKLTAYAEDHGRTLLELSIAWLLSEKSVCTVLTGASRKGHITANANASDWALTQQERNEITEISEKYPSNLPDNYYSTADYFDKHDMRNR